MTDYFVNNKFNKQNKKKAQQKKVCSITVMLKYYKHDVD